MYLIFDTETTGLPKKWEVEITDTSNWPRLVQLAWLLFDKEGEEIESKSFIIKPCGFIIPSEISCIHGISTERALNVGHPLEEVLYHFNNDLNKATILIAHNIDFDEKVLRAEFHRLGIHNSIQSMKKICTMKSTVDFCKFKSTHGYRWPKLPELYFKLFNKKITDSHNAEDDVRNTALCFWELVKRNHYAEIIDPKKSKKRWGSDTLNISEILSNEFFNSNWSKWENGQLLRVKTISKSREYVYFDTGLVTKNEHLLNEEVFIHGYITEDQIPCIFSESGLGIWLRSDKAEYMVDYDGITHWRRADNLEDEKLLKVDSVSDDGKYVLFTNHLKTLKEHLYNKQGEIFTFDENVFNFPKSFMINGKWNYIYVNEGFKGYTNSIGLTFWEKE